MIRRSLPPIVSTDLRDHADPDRVERIWQRIERDLSVAERATGSHGPRRTWVFAAAAALAAFGGGVFVGRTATHGGDAVAPAAVASPDRVTVDVFAAGSRARTLKLPGGGAITLAPETTVEIMRADATSLTLSLLRGEASVDVESVPTDKALAIVAGEAMLSTQAGSVVRVRRSTDHMDVDVDAGSAKISSPSGVQHLKRGERAEAVPIRNMTAILQTPDALRGVRAPSVAASGGSSPIEPQVAAVAAPTDWMGLATQSKFKEAFELLKQQPGGVRGAIAAAKAPAELINIGYSARRGDPDAAIEAYTSLLQRFPADANADIAAYQLVDSYARKGQPDKAREYLARVARPDVAENALCKLMQAIAGQGNKVEAARLANDYVNKHPNGGGCKADAERILAGEDDHDNSSPATSLPKSDAP